MTPDEFVQFCSDLTEAVEDKDSYIITPLWGVLSIFQKRVFEKGKNTAGGQIGYYGGYFSKEFNEKWIPVRQKYGLQVDYVDLDFRGDLKNSIQLSRDSDRENYWIGFNDEQERTKADFQEHLQGWKAAGKPKKKPIMTSKPMEIFALSDKEYKDFNELLDKAFELRTLMAISKYR